MTLKQFKTNLQFPITAVLTTNVNKVFWFAAVLFDNNNVV